MSRLNRLFTAIVLLLIAGSAFADSGSLAGIHHFANRLAPPETDYSVAYLGQIFGTVGDVLSGTSGQVLGHMFGIFNKGILVVAALYLGFTIVSLAIHAAHQGSFMSQKYNTPMILLRIAFGFAITIPSSTTGYSLTQDVFMKIVVQSVGLADQVWDAALKYIQYGGSLYIRPKTLSTDTNIITNFFGTSTTPGVAVTIFEDEVCMIKSASSAWNPSSNSITQRHLVFNPPKNAATKNYPYPSKLGEVFFPGLGDKPDSDAIIKTGQAACGVATPYSSVTVKTGSAMTSTTMTAMQVQQMRDTSFSALKQMAISMLPAAHDYVNLNPADSSNTQALHKKNTEKAVFSSILAYVNLITPYQQMLSAQHAVSAQATAQSAADAANFTTACGVGGLFISGFCHYTASQFESSTTKAQLSHTSHLAFIQTAKAQGWIMAGRFYWDVEQANTTAQSISISGLLPTATTPTLSIHKTTMTDAVTAILGYQTDVTTLWSEYVGAQNNTVSYPSTGSGSGGTLVKAVSNSSLSKVAGAVYDLTQPGGYNPIVVLMHLGTKLMEAVVGIWIGAIVLSVAGAVPAGVCDAMSPGGVIYSAILTWLKSIIMLISTGLLVPGAIFGYYLPLYPFIVFTFAAVGWFLMVIEGMAAAPLIGLGVTHPEGHDFLGKSDQVLMFLLGIFVRPTLMVLGLVGAMVISFVAFHMMITGFDGIYSSLSSQITFQKGSLLILINICMVLIVFGMMSLQLVEQCFKLIYQLPQYVMRWIGGPTMGEDYGQMAQGVQGAISGGAGKFAQGGGDAAGATIDAYKAKKFPQNDPGKPGSGSQATFTPGGGGGNAPGSGGGNAPGSGGGGS